MRPSWTGCAARLAPVLLWGLLPLTALADPELRIRGRLLDEQGTPVANQTVYAVCTGALPEGPRIDCGFPGLHGRKAQTDADGRFSLEKLPPAVYSLFSAIEALGAGRKVEAEVTRSLELRQDVDGLELRLTKPKQPPHRTADGKSLIPISGKVVDRSGAPIHNAYVRAIQHDSPPGPRSERQSGDRYTDALGNFRTRALPEGLYRLEVSADGFLRTQRVIQLSEAELTLTLTRAGVVRGQVVMPDGSPAVSLKTGCGNARSSQLPEGRFEEFNVHEGGEMRLCLLVPGMSRFERIVTVLPDQELDLGVIRMGSARVLMVQVTDARSGKPVQGASVQAADPQVSAYLFSTQADGSASLKDFPDQALELTVRAPGFLGARIQVSKGQTEVKVALDPGSAVTGRALDAQGKPQLGSVMAVCSQGGRAQAQLDAEGRFQLEGLSEGSCHVLLQVFSPPLPTFEHSRQIWVDRSQPLHLEFQYPAVRHNLHIRLAGTAKPEKAVLFSQEFPPQLELGLLLRTASLLAMPSMPEVNGYRVARREPEGFRFDNIGAGTYTLVVFQRGGYFRTVLTVGAEEQTLSIEVPPQLTPLPER